MGRDCIVFIPVALVPNSSLAESLTRQCGQAVTKGTLDWPVAPVLPHLGFGTSYLSTEFLITVSRFSDSCVLVVMRLHEIAQGKQRGQCLSLLLDRHCCRQHSRSAKLNSDNL